MSQSKRLRGSHIPYAAKTSPKRLSTCPLFTADDARTLMVNSPLLNFVEVNTEHYLVGAFVTVLDYKANHSEI